MNAVKQEQAKMIEEFGLADLGRKKSYCFRLSGVTINQLDVLVRASVSAWQLSPMSDQPACSEIANRSTILRQVIQDAYDVRLSQETRAERMEQVRRKAKRRRKR